MNMMIDDIITIVEILGKILSNEKLTQDEIMILKKVIKEVNKDV
jgi:hypothetical protein